MKYLAVLLLSVSASIAMGQQIKWHKPPCSKNESQEVLMLSENSGPMIPVCVTKPSNIRRPKPHKKPKPLPTDPFGEKSYTQHGEGDGRPVFDGVAGWQAPKGTNDVCDMAHNCPQPKWETVPPQPSCRYAFEENCRSMVEIRYSNLDGKTLYFAQWNKDTYTINANGYTCTALEDPDKHHIQTDSLVVQCLKDKPVQEPKP